VNTLKNGDGVHKKEPLTVPRRGYNDVLALVTSSGPWSPAAFAGVDIAAMFNAHVTGCYIDPSLRSLRGIDNEPTVLALLMNMPHASSDDYDAFSAFARTRGVRRVSWVATQVAPAKTMRSLGAWHDLIVLERDLTEPSVLVDVLGEALLTCRAPCLVLPPGWDKPLRMDRIAIGWNGSIEATRATHASLPLAEAAQQVIVLRDSALALDSEDPQPPPFDPTFYLNSHGVKVSEQVLYTSPLAAGQAILAQAKRLAADCLVMGAYGHARVRERLLGGATRYILQHADMPVLMQH
jgi:nucleotide-binding universal stress UspA family protein